MPSSSPPIPQNPIGENHVWRDWFQKLSNKVFGSMASQDATSVEITGGSITGVSGLVTAVTATAPIASSGGTTPIISISQAGTSTNGYLSSTDWNTFNNKGSGTITSVTGTSPVASSGGTTPAISLATGYGDTQNPYASKTANYFLAAPNGSSGAPTFRAIVSADVPTLNQNTTGTATYATNLAGGSPYAVPYQSGSGSTQFLSAGTSGSVLMTLGTVTAPVWVAATSLNVASASNIDGGSANQLVYQTNANTTSFASVSTGLSFSGGTLTNTGYTTAPVTYTASTYTIGTTDYWVIANYAGTSTVTLPTASSYTGRVLRLQNYQAYTVVSASSNVVPIVGGSATTAILNAVAGDTCTLVSNGTNWLITEYVPNNTLLI